MFQKINNSKECNINISHPSFTQIVHKDRIYLKFILHKNKNKLI